MKISVIGGGYVGLVSSVCFAELGHSVNLIEIDEYKLRAINSGNPTIYEKGLEDLLAKHAGDDLIASSTYEGVLDSEITFICVGTPPSENGAPDLSMIKSASRSIGAALREGDGYHVVAVKSTVLPGTTQNIVRPIVERESGRGEMIGFAMNPEFLREGVAVQDFMKPDRIVIGSSQSAAGDRVEAIYEGVNAPMIRTSLEAAEMIKYASNAFLATKISFSNEIGNICKRLGIDVYEVMKGVGLDHRISPHFLHAGVGFGGSCFPKDVSALIHLAESTGETPCLLRSVMEVNNHQPLRMVELLSRRIGDLKDKRIAVLGLAFKNDTDDIRESRAVPVIKELVRLGALVSAYDPKANQAMSCLIQDIQYCTKAADALRDTDACLIMTEWPEFGALDQEFDLMKSKVIIEGRRILSCKEREGVCW